MNSPTPAQLGYRMPRSEEHTSELQPPCNLLCRLLLEKKNAVARIDRVRTAAPIGAQIGAPRLVARAGSLRQRLAMGVRTREAPEIAAFAGPGAGDEDG